MKRWKKPNSKNYKNKIPTSYVGNIKDKKFYRTLKVRPYIPVNFYCTQDS